MPLLFFKPEIDQLLHALVFLEVAFEISTDQVSGTATVSQLELLKRAEQCRFCTRIERAMLSVPWGLWTVPAVTRKVVYPSLKFHLSLHRTI